MSQDPKPNLPPLDGRVVAIVCASAASLAVVPLPQSLRGKDFPSLPRYVSLRQLHAEAYRKTEPVRTWFKRDRKERVLH